MTKTPRKPSLMEAYLAYRDNENALRVAAGLEPLPPLTVTQRAEILRKLQEGLQDAPKGGTVVDGGRIAPHPRKDTLQ